MVLAKEKNDKLNQLILNVYRTFSKKSIQDLFEYNLSSDFESEEDIVNSMPYVTVLLYNQSLKEKCLTIPSWVTWAKARRMHITSDGPIDEMLKRERDRIIKELNIFEAILSELPEILKNNIQTSIANCIEEINYMLHKEDSTIYVNVELDDNKLITEIMCGELETKSGVEQKIKDTVLKILQLGTPSEERPSICTTITMIV